LPGKNLLYHYTVLGMNASDFQKEAFIAEKRPFLINSYKTTESMKTLREHGVDLSYIYQAEDGTTLAEIRISPKDF